MPAEMRKRLRYLMPSLPQSLLGRPVILRVLCLLSGKVRMKSRIYTPPPLMQEEIVSDLLAIWMLTNLWDKMESIPEY